MFPLSFKEPDAREKTTNARIMPPIINNTGLAKPLCLSKRAENLFTDLIVRDEKTFVNWQLELTKVKGRRILKLVNTPVQRKIDSTQKGFAPLVLLLIGAVVVAAVALSKGKPFDSAQGKPSNNGQSTSASLGQQTEQKTTGNYSSYDHKISIQTPAKWQLKENTQQGIQATFFAPKEGDDDEFIENINLHVSDLSAKPNVTLEEIVKIWNDQSKSEYPDSYEIVSQSKTTLGGIKAIKLIAKATDGSLPFKNMAVFALKDSISYIINYSAEGKSFDKFLPDVEKLLRSVKLGAQKLSWEDYKSKEYGYSVKIPVGWKVTDTPKEGSRETSIVHPGARALVLITALFDPNLKDLDYMKSSIKEFKEKLEKDPTILKLAKFTDKVEGSTGAFIAIGEEKREGLNWYFEQRGMMGTSGKVLLFHGAALSSSYKDYKNVISQIIESFKVN